VPLATIAAGLVIAAIVGLAINFMGATGGHCGDDGCSSNFPQWLYDGSGWVVVLAVFALLVVGAFWAMRGLRRTLRRR
jgi:hypothetical protein